jgi:hypothetical protein
MESTPTNGFNVTPNVIEKRFARTSATEVRFWGYGGDDGFVNNVNINTKAYGGTGNDYLEGSSGVDVFYGGAGHDRLLGYSGNDFLYGDGDNDTLEGGAGNDYFHGGDGFDTYRDDYRLFTNGVAATDINQGQSGVCTILAGVAETILNNFDKRGDWGSRVLNAGNGYYDVWLYNSATLSGGSGKWYRTYFNGTWTDEDASPTKDTAGVREVWGVIVQRAVLDSYNVPWQTKRADQWGTWWQSSKVALERLTGYTASYQHVPSVTASALKSRLASYFVSAESKSVDVTSSVAKNHAYAVRDVYQTAGLWYVRLYNPWGTDSGSGAVTGENDGYITLSWSTFTSAFANIIFA